MDTNKQHEQYVEYKPLINLVYDTLRDDLIKKHKANHLPVPNAIAARLENPKMATQARAAYEELGEGGELPSVTSETLNEIIGVFFVNPLQVPELYENKTVTNTGKDLKGLTRSTVKNISLSGRHVLVVDAPQEGGEPWIAEYSALSMDDWETDSDGILTYVKLYEGKKIIDGSQKRVYRIYLMEEAGVTVSIYHDNERYGEVITLSVDEIPVYPIGSIDDSPDWDEIPLLKTAQSMRQYYRLSCYYNRALNKANDYTTAVSGIVESEAQTIAEQGSGNGALWWSENPDAKWEFLEVQGNGIAKAEAALEKIEARAKEYGMQFLAGANEAAETIRMRKEAKLMSISTVADSISQGITKALTMLATMQGVNFNDNFTIKLPSTNALYTIDGVKAVEAWSNAGQLPDIVVYNQQKKMGAHEDTGIETFEDFKAALQEQAPDTLM